MAVKVNHVWFGDNPLGPLEKFNVYSWRALGHEVTIYAHRWDGTPHTEGSLGLANSGVTVVNLSSILDEDDTQRPKTLAKTRAVLKEWIGATKKKPSTESIFNMVDLAKSYVGGTRRGIVLDLKVGPSSHLADYEPVFRERFVSYTRGTNTAEWPENQCIGTMQDADTLREAYAKAFESRISGNIEGPGGLRAAPAGAHYNMITGCHGQGFADAEPNINVARYAPDGKPTGSRYEVKEIGPPNYGPFRVFKMAGDQTHRDSAFKTKPEDVAELCQWVWDKELKNNESADKNLLAEVEKAMKALPAWKAPAVKNECPKCGKPVKATPTALRGHELECTGKK